MGKKIPGAKHRTVKYPEQQKRLRELKLYNKVNNPPKVLDAQEVPKGVRKIKEFKEKFKILEEKEERKKQEKKNRKLQKTLKEAQFKVDKKNLLQRFLKKDSNEDQVIVINEMRRVKRAQPLVTPKKLPETITISTETSTTPSSQYEIKQKAKQDRHNQQAKQRKLLSELSKEYPSLNIPTDNTSEDKKSGRRQMKRNPNKKLNKREKDKMKQKMKQSEKEDEVDRSAPVYDKVEFGEIVHAPPKLSKRPRNTEVESKPGKKSQNLLLASMLNPSLKASPSQPPPRKFNYSTNLTGKRKDLSMADRRRLDKEQAMAIAAYKKLKADRWQAGQGK
uniref:Coiled-coil domain-containing protein 137 n=2 Tax=Cacopsylla melanoneura TaxID=428564 RepID=A0A8D8Y5C1_9HEMI